MGLPSDEVDRQETESPQHEVSVPPFFIGHYPVTQVQWAAVAALPKIDRDLDRDPSRFRGGNRPVENALRDETMTLELRCYNDAIFSYFM